MSVPLCFVGSIDGVGHSRTATKSTTRSIEVPCRGRRDPRKRRCEADASNQWSLLLAPMGPSLGGACPVRERESIELVVRVGTWTIGTSGQWDGAAPVAKRRWRASSERCIAQTVRGIVRGGTPRHTRRDGLGGWGLGTGAQSIDWALYGARVNLLRGRFERLGRLDIFGGNGRLLWLLAVVSLARDGRRRLLPSGQINAQHTRMNE